MLVRFALAGYRQMYWRLGREQHISQLAEKGREHNEARS